MPIRIKPLCIKPHFDMQYYKPKIHLVSILNDHYVSWEFCMRMLQDVFYKSKEDAEAITHEILTNGEGFCGGYIYEIAETKAELVEKQAKKEGFSILCLVEEV